MQTKFAPEDKNFNLALAAGRWMGTPFREHTEICQVGADCVHLVRALYVEAGFPAPEIGRDDYPLDWAMHRSHSLVLEWLRSVGRFAPVAKGEALRPGDVLCFKQGRCSHHIGVLFSERKFIHTLPGRYAEEGQIDDSTWADRLALAFRLTT